MNLDAARATDGWMADDELVWLAEQAQSCRTIIEVGCWKGRSTLALADNTAGKVYAVDHWQGTPGDAGHEAAIAAGGPDGIYLAFVENVRSRIEMGKVISIRGISTIVAAYFDHSSADLVFIDAGHLHADVKRDINAYRPLVKPGGILCGHDYACPSHAGVQQAVDEVFPEVNRAGLSIWWVRL